MKTILISLNTIDKVKKFVNEVSKINADVDLISGRYTIDAKSIMGIFSLDLSKPIEMQLGHINDKEEIEVKKFEELAQKYLAKN